MTTEFEITATPSADDLAFVGQQLSAFNDADVGASDRTSLAVFVRDENGKILAGISGYTAWGWLYIQWLWVDSSLRGQRVAGKMLQAAEDEALARGCHSALIDTFSPVAKIAYERQGYEVFGELPDFPIGRTRSFLKKRLANAS
ncbi:GNAT superfamily N-acetyltransferase [Paenochrobactrum gallinarii]|uniref:GNAT superfamily N-acetyltransferase n=1 Tax=Paenochrobactrum gallinarii TaxID=643673 RepID=A0A841LYD1_9HYPH|nr:GNAT family N-acetyltransferase [Paenochrobactrum gallinarii]MBB6261860.1 GNAT superfamily N-acetyltransferase [Paenochrobactrum gallinarii]